MGICFPYLGEFQPTKYREKILCWMELFWTVGIIALPLIAWSIIPWKFKFVYGNYFFGSWNLFVAVCALPSILIGLWLFAFPESPKFLMECGEAEAAIDVLKDIFQRNTGKRREDYPVKTLKEKEHSNHNISNKRSIRMLKISKPKELKILLGKIWEQTKSLSKPPHLKNTTLACAIQFGITTSYYTLMIWFPELFYRYESFERHHPNETASVCEVSSIVLQHLNK